MSQDVAIDQIQPGDHVHFTTQRCPGDHYVPVVAITAKGSLIVIHRGIRREVARKDVTAAVRTDPPPRIQGPILQG